MQWLFRWFYPKANTGVNEDHLFLLFAQLDYVTLANTIDIWTKWILNKALPTFLLFLITSIPKNSGPIILCLLKQMIAVNACNPPLLIVLT